MQYDVIITKKPDAPWRAVVREMPECTVEAATREEALARIKESIAESLQQGYWEVVPVEVSLETDNNGDSLLPDSKTFAEKWPYFGAFRDDPTWGEMFDEIERQRDATRLES